MDKVGGHPTNLFLAAPHDNVVCPICLEVLKNPCQCCNGHNFCLFCITRVSEVTGECPVCRCNVTLGQNIATNIFARDVVNNMMVRCHIVEQDAAINDNNEFCDWIGNLHARETHVALCPFHHPFLCPYFVGGDGCLATCQIRYNTNSKFRTHLSEHAAKKKLQIELLTEENSVLKVGHDLGFAVVRIPQNDFAPESIYCGQVSPDMKLRVGLGVTFIIGTNSSYSGQCVDNMKDGKGYNQTEEGTYFGMWKKDKRHGRCIFATFLVDEMCYSGGYRDDLMHGTGRWWTDRSSFCYFGKFVLGMKQEQGKLIHASGLKIYTGSFVNDVIQGQGVSTDVTTNETITGNFSENGLCDGEGVLRNSVGVVIYSGGFVRSRFEGHGILNQADGSVYTGDFVNGLKEGRGKLVYNDNSCYIGSFFSGLCHGRGVLTGVNGVNCDMHYVFGEDVEAGERIVVDLSD